MCGFFWGHFTKRKRFGRGRERKGKRFGCACFLRGFVLPFLVVIACDTRQGNEASMGDCWLIDWFFFARLFLTGAFSWLMGDLLCTIRELHDIDWSKFFDCSYIDCDVNAGVQALCWIPHIMSLSDEEVPQSVFRFHLSSLSGGHALSTRSEQSIISTLMTSDWCTAQPRPSASLLQGGNTSMALTGA